jgi:glycosyltransferase involved in cell wall biosynthesis
MTICFITNSSQMGGAERVLLETIDVFNEQGIECRVLVPRAGDLTKELEALGIPYAFLDGGSWISWTRPSLWTRLKATVKITGKTFAAGRQIRQWGCDVIFSNTLTVCHGSIVARLLGLPHIWHLHEFGKEDHGVFYKFGERFSNRAIGNLSSACVVVSNAMAAKYGRFVASSKLAIVYPSMHLALRTQQTANPVVTYLPATIGRLRLVIVGGVAESKGQADAIRALSDLAQRGVDAELLLVGEDYPAYRRKLDEMIKWNELDNRVHFIGKVPDTFPILQTADIVLVCSRAEAFGRATVEAMLAERPVVGAARGATAELIRNGFNGLLYNYDDPTDLASKIQFLRDHPAYSRQLGQRGKTWAAGQFSKERYSKEMMAVLSSVIHERSCHTDSHAKNTNAPDTWAERHQKSN